MRRTDGSLAWAALDLTCCLLLVVYTLVAPPKARTSNVTTEGAYAVVLEWPRASRDDLDLYLQDPAGKVAWYGQPDAAELHLEHDDLGAKTNTGYQLGPNYERAIVRTTAVGTFAAVVHMYCKRDSKPVTATVELWKLGTSQQPLRTRRLVIAGRGQQQTAFRWRLDASGAVVGTDELPANLSQAAGEGVGC
jgi:hypothetical protein